MIRQFLVATGVLMFALPVIAQDVLGQGLTN